MKENSTTTSEKSELEIKFATELEKLETKVAKYLLEAENALQKAIKASEKAGIPIRIDLSCMPMDRLYTPQSLLEQKCWKKFDADALQDLIADYDLMSLGDDDSGYEHWDASSLLC